MDSMNRKLVRDTFDASNAEQIHFGEVIARMINAGVESYSVDYRSHSATYYGTSGEALTLEMEASPHGIDKDFAAERVQEAIRGAQKGAVMYQEFKRRTMQAGCVGYTVWIAGRHVTYFGRKGETHVERFPD
jgi:uncharacterized protein YbcV (DUF1398 family)